MASATAGLAAITAALALSACGQDTAAKPSPSPTASQDEHDPAEVAAPAPRLVITYDGGVQVLDALSLELVADLPLSGFNRINPAGDERHVFVSTEGGFKLLDTGVFASAHGDHAHYYAGAPVLEEGLAYEAKQPGHVVAHDGLTALFDDGTGHVDVLDSDDLDESVREYDAPAAHHGVAVALPDGSLVVSQGTEEARSGIVVLDAAGAQVAASSDCPAIHGEAVAAGEAAVFGCQDGALVYKDGAITKIPAPAPAGGLSSLYGTEDSPVVLGDYDTEGQPMDQVSLTDTAGGAIKLVKLPTAYYGFNDSGFTDDGRAFVLGLDGKLHFIDVTSGVVTGSYPVISPWQAPAEWQAAAPKVVLVEGMIYVTDPANKAIVAVDPATGEVWKSGTLTVAPLEITGVTGEGAGEHEHGDHDDEDEHDE
jgi:outer membrane protein assembly factor BamB